MTLIELVPGMPHLRRLRMATNLGCVPPEVDLAVAEEGSDDGDLIYFKTFDLLAAYKPEDYLADGPLKVGEFASFVTYSSGMSTEVKSFEKRSTMLVSLWTINRLKPNFSMIRRVLSL